MWWVQLYQVIEEQCEFIFQERLAFLILHLPVPPHLPYDLNETVLSDLSGYLLPHFLVTTISLPPLHEFGNHLAADLLDRVFVFLTGIFTAVILA